MQIRQEAISRQGTEVKINTVPYLIQGDATGAKFEMGEEGLVHLAVETKVPTAKRRIKVFWVPDEVRRERSLFLVSQSLSDEKRAIDVLGGAPYAMLEQMGEFSRFALVMKNVEGSSWKDLRQDGDKGVYPPPGWPPLKIRLLWAYGLAWAVQQMEALNFVHADISDGNVVVEAAGSHAGAMALVDFDAYYNETFPSSYRGTSGFVAPEIWNSGSIGIGSDRVAMAILIQEFLIVGDPALDKQEAFADRYTQDEICSFQSGAHPLLKRKYPALAALVDDTLKTVEPQARPKPEAWRVALVSIYRELQRPAFQLTTLEGFDAGEFVRLSEGEAWNLRSSSFGIRADIVHGPAGELHLRPHPGAQVQWMPGQETWRDADADIRLTEECLLSDPEGLSPARFIPEGQNKESISTLEPVSFHQWTDVKKKTVTDAKIDTGLPRKKVSGNLRKPAGWIGLAIALVVSLLAWWGYSWQHTPKDEREVLLNLQRTRFDALPVFTPSPGIAGRQLEPWNGPLLQPPPIKDERQVLRRLQRASFPPLLAPATAAVIVAKPRDAYQGVLPRLGGPTINKFGTFSWHGQVNGTTLLVIEDGAPSFGTISGTPLPGVMCLLQISDKKHFSIAQAPGPGNQWRKIILNVHGKGNMNVTLTWALP